MKFFPGRHAIARNCLLLAVVLGAAPAIAQTKPSPSAGDLDEARQRFQRGVELYKEGSFDAALAEFNKAYELAPNYRVLFNLAQVQNERHDYVSALQDFQKYLDQGGAEISADRRDQVNKEITALRGRVADLTITADVDGAEVLVDGVSAGTLPLSQPVLVSAGVRQLQVKKVGYETSTRTETIAGGDDLHFDFKLQAIPSATPTVATTPPVFSQTENSPPSETADRSSNVPFWVTLASTTLLAGGAVTFGVLTNSANSRLDHELGSFPGNPGGIDDARSTLKRDALITDILTGTAVVSGGLCVFFALHGSHGKSTQAAQTTLRVGPAGPGVRMLGTF
ncbi:MAG TPA: PEGA domain-containing protein [Polyangiaceae bacterium]|nr:PEGA domain-containing protein [Polyangiaceae bacterium]